MKLLGLTLIICTLVCVCVGSSDGDKCYRLSPMQVSCHSSGQIHMKVIRGPPGKPGAKGKDVSFVSSILLVLYVYRSAVR